MTTTHAFILAVFGIGIGAAIGLSVAVWLLKR